ncbi:hypothetical protein IO45_00160 [Gallibacterium anatis]|uniref:tail fiber protein n=1 Tax=Gallibacterium anatis TaxID=750 RepID=UPI0005317FD5|nr:tail fiber protein [Gallibacterium anatis]KGQ61709.1 hypothetical protein IO45_00160 [Gallibacterium anatis]
MGTPSSITASTTNSVTSTSHTHAIEKGSLTTSGIVQLTDSVNQDSSVFAATAKAVKTAFDKAVGAYNAAAGKVSKAGDTMTGVLRAADFVMNRNGNQKLSSLFDALIKLAQGDATGFQNIVNTWGNAGTTPLGITYNFTNANAWYICFGPFFGNLVIQGGHLETNVNGEINIIYPIKLSYRTLILTAMHIGSGGVAFVDRGASNTESYLLKLQSVSGASLNWQFKYCVLGV